MSGFKIRKISGNNLLTIALIGLIALSIIQTGILWTNQTYGGTLGSIFGKGGVQNGQSATMNDKTVIEELFKPYDIVLCNGTDPDKAVLNPANDNFETIWTETAAYIKDAYGTKSESLNRSEWAGIYSKKAFISEFKTNINTDIMAWFLGVNKLPSGDLDGVYKVALSYGEGAAGTMAVYILDDTELHRFEIPLKSIGKDRFDEIMAANASAPADMVYKPVPGDIVLQTRDDLLFNGTETDKTSKYSVISLQTPAALKMANPDSPAEQRNVAGAILSSERYSFETDLTKDGTLIIANLNNIYSLDNNGYMEYESKTAAGETVARGNIKDAFINAMKFIYDNNRRNMASKVSLYLSGIIENKDSYTFLLNYRVSDSQMLPVYMDYFATIGTTTVEVSDAIDITATGSNVISAKWLFRQVERILSFAEIDMRFNSSDINSMIDKNYSGLFSGPDGSNIDMSELQAKQTFINDIGLAYMVNYKAGQDGIKPEWAMATNLSKNRYLYNEGVN